MKVFVTQYFEHGDFSKAEDWGEVRFMTQHEHKPEPCHPGHNVQISNDLRRMMADYIPGIDMILVAPSQVVNVLVGAMLKPGITHKVLKWDNRTRNYRLHLLNL